MTSHLFSRFFERRILTPILIQIKQGVTPHQIALAISLGAVIGIFPIIGSTTVLCLIVGILFKLNQPTLQIFNYLVYPLQILLVLVFVRIGEFAFNANSISFYPSQLKQEFFADPLIFFQRFGLAGLHAIVAWTISAPFITIIIYSTLRWLLKKMAPKNYH